MNSKVTGIHLHFKIVPRQHGQLVAGADHAVIDDLEALFEFLTIERHFAVHVTLQRVEFGQHEALEKVLYCGAFCVTGHVEVNLQRRKVTVATPLLNIQI